MKIFVTGATGYIGGSVAQLLTDRGHEVFGLVRDQEKADRLSSSGIVPVIGDLDDGALLAREAAKTDGVVNAAASMHESAVAALIEGLKGSGKPLIHSSGIGMVSHDVCGDRTLEKVMTDDQEIRPGPHAAQHAMRAVEAAVLDSADLGLRSIVISNPLIYGTGLGLKPDSIQVPMMVRQANARRVSGYLGRGVNRWTNVHVADMADLFVRALEAAPARAFYFAANAEASFAQIATAIADALGIGPARSFTMEEAAAAWGGMAARYLLGSDSRAFGVRGMKELGWAPAHCSVTDWIRGEMPRS